MFAYETDGFGSFLLMDDANIPSLLALPYLGYTYRRVRVSVLLALSVGRETTKE